MKILDEIKKLMADDETVKAEEMLKELLAAEPDNLYAKILHGTCCLRNDPFDDDAANVYEELGSEVERRIKDGKDPELEQIWNDYIECSTTPISYSPLMEEVIIAILIALACFASIWYFGRQNVLALYELVLRYFGRP